MIWPLALTSTCRRSGSPRRKLSCVAPPRTADVIGRAGSGKSPLFSSSRLISAEIADQVEAFSS